MGKQLIIKTRPGSAYEVRIIELWPFFVITFDKLSYVFSRENVEVVIKKQFAYFSSGTLAD